MYGIVRFAEAADALGLPTSFGAELSLERSRAADTQAERMIAARVGVPDPPGTHLLALARDPAGTPALCRVISKAQLRGGAKGRPVYDFDELADAADGHWLVLTGCRKGAVRPRTRAGTRGTFALDPARAGARRAGRPVRPRQRRRRAHLRTRPARRRALRRAGHLADEAGLPIVATTAAHYHGPPRRPLATAMAAVRARSTPRRDRRLAAGLGRAHLRSGAEMAERFARWPGRSRPPHRLGKRDRVPAAADRTRPAAVPGAAAGTPR